MRSVRQLMRRKAYRTFFFSFILAFLLPVLALFAVMSRLTAVVQLETEKSNQLVLEQFINGVDGQLYTVMRLADSLLVDDKALYFAERDDPMRLLNNISSFQMLKNLTQEVGIMPTTYADIELCYLYLPRSDKIISNTISDSADFYARKLSHAYTTQAQWLHFLQTQPTGFFQSGGAVQYLSTLRRGDTALITSVIAIGQGPFARYQSIFDAQSAMDAAIFSAQGEPLFHTGIQAPSLQEIMHTQADGSQSVRIGDESFHALWKRSADTGCIFLTLVPEGSYNRPLHTLRVSMGVGFVALLAFGLLLSLWLSRRQYRPILALRTFIDSNAKSAGDAHSDDFDYLSEMMRAMDDEKKNADMQMRSTQEKIEQFALERLLKGMYGSVAVMEEQLLSLNLTLDSDHFLVVGLRIDDFIDSMHELRLEDRLLMRFVVSNVFEELLRAYDAHCTVSDGLVWAICAIPADASWHEDIEALLLQGRQFMRERFQIALTITASDPVTGLEGIHRGYRDALQLLRHAEQLRDTFLLKFKQQSETVTTSAAVLPMSANAQHLAQRIAEGDEAGVLAWLSTFSASISTLPHYLSRMQWVALLQGILMLDGEHDAQTSEDIQKRVRLFMEASPLQDDHAAMAALCQYLCALPRTSADIGKGTELAQRVRDYIEVNYAASSLNITQIADYLDLTASYASALYKRQTGESMMDTINQVRLRHAKQLLLQSDKTLDDIALEVGYYSTSTFLRAFKKREGITPGQYRTLAARGSVL